MRLVLSVVVLAAVAVAPVVWVARLSSEAAEAEAFAASLRAPILAEPGGVMVTTELPILRVQRAPEALVRPVIDARLASELLPVAASWPQPFCLDVHIDGRQVLSVGEEAQTPASVEKLLTAVAVLALIPDDVRFSTTVVTDGEIVDGQLIGDAWVIGGGDPLITTLEYSSAYSRQPQLRSPIEDLADQLAALGIVGIQGRLVADESRYDTIRYVETWPDRYRAQHNVGPLSALTLNDGFTAWTPQRTDAADPGLHFVDGLRSELRDRSVDVGGGLAVGVAPAGATVIAELTSPPLIEVVQEMLRESDNNTAELLLKELGLREAGVGSTIAGADVATRTVAALVPDEQLPLILDGSGLDPDNQVTCGLLTALLDLHGPGSDLAAGLPVANESGTLAHRFEDDPAAGRLAAKTGLLNNVNGLAGFVTNDGGIITFAQLLNGVPLRGTLGVDIQEELVAVLLRHPGDLDASDVLGE